MTFQEAILAVRGGRDLGATEMVDLMRLIMTGFNQFLMSKKVIPKS